MGRPIIAITMGDPSGVGPEIIAKSMADAELHERARVFVIGSAARVRQAMRITGSSLDLT